MTTAPGKDNPDENTAIDAILAKSPPLGLKIPEGTTFEHWLALGKRLALADSVLAWRIGDWWDHGEHRYGDRISAVHASGWNGPSFGTCRNYATVARAFKTSRRRDVLSFSHHQEVASLSSEDADRLLDWAEEPLRNHDKPRSTRELRRQVDRQNGTRRRALNRSRIESADTEWLWISVSPSREPARLDDSPNILPVPAELAALRVEPPPDLDRVAIARAARGAIDCDQRVALFLECPGEVRIAHARLTHSAASAP